MTRDDIIRMAREAGFSIDGPYICTDDPEGIIGGELDRFAALVSEHERKACAEHYLGIMREAIKEEREACRSIVMEAFDDTWSGTKENNILYEIATAVRARSDT